VRTTALASTSKIYEKEKDTLPYKYSTVVVAAGTRPNFRELVLLDGRENVN
jgi:hypothetical protein